MIRFVFQEDKESEDCFHSHVKLMETKRKEVFYDKLTFIYLEMPKFNKKIEELESHFDKWMYVLKNLSQLEDRPQKLQERIFQKIFKIAEIEKYNKADRAKYESSLKYYRDINNVVDTSFGDGLKVGLSKGIEQGIEEAIKKLIKSGMSSDEAHKLLL